MKILVDSSVWIDYFRGGNDSFVLSDLLESNQVCTNDLILTELIPFLIQRKEFDVVDLFHSLEKMPMNIDWEQIQEYQLENLQKGINKVGIPDLIILQNTLQNKSSLFSFDKHFSLMQKWCSFDLFLN